jgi:uncharacterized MnhB-related membrane protein
MVDALLALMVIVSVVALLVRDMLAAVLVLGVFSLLSCLVFFLLHAPDVALTEAAVGTGVGTVILIWIVYRTDRRDRS